MILLRTFAKAALRITVLLLAMWIFVGPTLAPISIFMEGTIDFDGKILIADIYFPHKSVTVLKSMDDLNIFLAEHSGQILGHDMEGSFSAEDLFGGYSEVFFKSRYIVIFGLWEPHAGVRHRVDIISRNGDIHITRMDPGGYDMEEIGWFIILELDNRIIPEEFNIVMEDRSFRL